MASIKQLTNRKFKITISNGYRPNGKKICKAKTITVPDSVKPRGIRQYVAHEAEELERLVKSGFAEDRDTTFETYAARWLEHPMMICPLEQSVMSFSCRFRSSLSSSIFFAVA